MIKMLAAKTHKLFKDIAYRIASSTIKQTLRRWAKVFHTKKLKPIYDLANSIGLMEYTAEEVIEMKAKESLYELTATSSRLQKKEFFVD